MSYLDELIAELADKWNTTPKERALVLGLKELAAADFYPVVKNHARLARTILDIMGSANAPTWANEIIERSDIHKKYVAANRTVRDSDMSSREIAKRRGYTSSYNNGITNNQKSFDALRLWRRNLKLELKKTLEAPCAGRACVAPEAQVAQVAPAPRAQAEPRKLSAPRAQAEPRKLSAPRAQAEPRKLSAPRAQAEPRKLSAPRAQGRRVRRAPRAQRKRLPRPQQAPSRSKIVTGGDIVGFVTTRTPKTLTRFEVFMIINSLDRLGLSRHDDIEEYLRSIGPFYAAMRRGGKHNLRTSPEFMADVEVTTGLYDGNTKTLLGDMYPRLTKVLQKNKGDYQDLTCAGLATMILNNEDDQRLIRDARNYKVEQLTCNQ
jgi:hypothetical protein